MRREEIFITESVLYALPELLRYLKDKEASFVSRSGGAKDFQARGGELVPEQQKAVERAEADSEYKLLSAAAEKLLDRFLTAPDSFRWVLRDAFFYTEDIRSLAAKKGYAPREIYRLKQTGIEFMAPVCLAMYPVVSRWRREIDALILEFHRKSPREL